MGIFDFLVFLPFPSPARVVGLTSPNLSIAYIATNNTITVSYTGAQPKRSLALEMSTSIGSTNWVIIATNTIANSGKGSWGNIPITNSAIFFQTAY
jgi:hypothetical protein